MESLTGSFELQLVVFLLFNVKGWDGGIKDGLEVFSWPSVSYLKRNVIWWKVVQEGRASYETRASEANKTIQEWILRLESERQVQISWEQFENCFGASKPTNKTESSREKQAKSDRYRKQRIRWWGSSTKSFNWFSSGAEINARLGDTCKGYCWSGLLWCWFEEFWFVLPIYWCSFYPIESRLECCNVWKGTSRRDLCSDKNKGKGNVKIAACVH